MGKELTEAERVVAEALAAHHNAHSTTNRLGVGAFEAEARAVVAAVQPIIESETSRLIGELIQNNADLQAALDAAQTEARKMMNEHGQSWNSISGRRIMNAIDNP
jgi:ATP-dependent helicase YprA (DUF1998 family)